MGEMIDERLCQALAGDCFVLWKEVVCALERGFAVLWKEDAGFPPSWKNLENPGKKNFPGKSWKIC